MLEPDPRLHQGLAHLFLVVLWIISNGMVQEVVPVHFLLLAGRKRAEVFQKDACKLLGFEVENGIRVGK